MALNKARKLFVFVFSFVLIVCTFVVLSSAQEDTHVIGEYDTSVRTGISYKYYALDDDPLLKDYGLRPLYFLDGNTACAYFTIYDITSGQFVDGTYYVLSAVFDEQSQSTFFTAQGSQYPSGVDGDYTSTSYSFGANHVIVWYGDTSASKCSDIQSYDWFCESYRVVSLNDLLGGLGYNDGYNAGYNDGFDDGYNDGVLNGDVSLTVGDNSVYIDPSRLTSRFYIEWYAVNDVVGREGWFIIFGDSESIFYVFSESGDLTDATVLSTLYTRERGWLSGYGAIINLPLNVLRPSRYATISIPNFATIQTDRDNLVGAISLFDYNVFDERFISLLGEVYRQLGYDDGFEIGNNRGYNRGYSEGYSVGYNTGVFDGSSNSNPKTFNKLGAFLVNSVGSFFDTELFFGFNIGHVLALITGVSLFFLLIRLLR